MSLTPEQIGSLIDAAAAEGLNLAAARVQAVTIPLTPLEYGDLRDSLVVTEATADDLTASVSSDLPYAVRQHEDLTYRHDDGQAKYLEVGGQQALPDCDQLMAAAARRALGS